MAKAFLTFTNLSLTDKILVDWAEVTAPLAILGTSQPFDPPHDGNTLTVDGLRPFVHRFRFWSSANGIDKDTFLLSVDVDCSQNASETLIYDYVVGRGVFSDDPDWADPGHGDTTVNDERLRGVYNFFIEQRGIGKLLDTEVTKTVDPEGVYTGQWSLNEIQFSVGDVFFAVVEKRATVDYSFTTAGGSGWSVVEQFASVTLNESYYNKFIECDFSTIQGVLSLPAINTVPAGTKLKVINASTSPINRYVKIVFASGTIKFHGKQTGVVWLGRGQSIEFLFTGTKCYVVDDKTGYEQIGQIIWAQSDQLIPNTLPMLGGDTYNINDVERLYWEYISLLPLNQIVDIGTYNSFTNRTINGIIKWDYWYKGFYGVNTTDGQFKLPDWAGRFIQGLDQPNDERDENYAGGLGMDQVGEFVANFQFKRTKRGAGGDPNHALATPDGDQFGTNPVPISMTINLGAHTKPKNLNAIPLICI